MLTKFFQLAVISILTSFSAGCSQPDFERNVYRFHTDGKIFLFSIFNKQGGVDLYRSGVDGTLTTVFPAVEFSTSGGHVGKHHIYYIENHGSRHYSKLRRCNRDFKECSTMYERSGAIRNPTELESGSILFQHSPYLAETHNVSGYARYRFYVLKIDNGKAEVQNTPSFAIDGSVVIVGTKLYFSASVPGENRNSITTEAIQFRSDRVADLRNETVSNMRIENSKLQGSFNLQGRYEYGTKVVYYLGLSPGGNYVYQTCVLSKDEPQICPVGVARTTHSVPANGKIYYAIADMELNKIAIQIIDAN